MQVRNSWIVALFIVLLTLGGSAWGQAPAETTEDPIRAGVFVVHHKPLADAFDVVSAILSADGQITLQRRAQTLVVKDHASVLELIGPALVEYDLPPRNIDITLSLMLAEDTRSRESGRNAPQQRLYTDTGGIQDVPADVLQRIGRLTEYQPLGTKAVAAIEGGSVTVALSDDYRVLLEVGEAVDGVIQFDSLTLQSVLRGEDGTVSYRDEYKAEVNVKTGQTFMLGAAKNPNSRRALFLAIQAKPR